MGTNLSRGRDFYGGATVAPDLSGLRFVDDEERLGDAEVIRDSPLATLTAMVYFVEKYARRGYRGPSL